MSDGTRIVTGSNDGTARVWDANTGQQLLILKGHAGPVISVAVAPDGDRIVTGSQDATTRLWDAKSGAEIAALRGHTRAVYGVAITPDGTRIITASEDTTVRLWNAKNATELAQMKGHTGRVSSLALMPDGNRVVTGSYDDTARIWDIKSGAELVQLKGHLTIHAVAVTPDGSRIITGSSDGTAWIWDLFPARQALIDQAKSLAPRCLTPAQRERFHLPATPPRWCDAAQKWPYDAVTVAENHLKEGRGRDAITTFTKAMALEPLAHDRLSRRLAAAHDQLAWNAYLNASLRNNPDVDLAEALLHAEKAVALAPTRAAFLDTRGQIHLALGHTQEAFEDLDNAISRGVTEAGAYYGRGCIHELKGNTPAAITDYRASLALEADTDYRQSFHTKARQRLQALNASAPAVAGK